MWSLLRFASLAALVACTGSQPDASDVTTPPGDGEGAVIDVSGEVAAEAAPKGPDVRIRDVGPYLVGTTRVVVHTRKDLFAEELVGGPPPEGTQLTMAPPVEGTLTVTERDTLSFVPTDGFQPDTAYVVTLRSLSTGTETFDPSSGGSWTHSFRTPPFQFARLALRNHDVERGRAEIDVLFTGPVEAKEVASRTTWTLGGAPIKPKSVAAGAEPHEVRVMFEGRELRNEGKLAIAVAEGVPLRTKAATKAPAGSGEIEIKPGKPLDLLAAKVREGTSGFYVDVVCRDHAVGTTRYYWDRVDYEDYQVSTRCLLGEDEARTSVRLEPPVDVTIASSPGGFRLFGDFDRGTYQLRIDAGATTVDGGVLKSAYEAELVVPGRSPSVSFTTKGRYLPRDAWRNLAIQHRNADLVDVRIRHVPESNLVFWLSGEEAASVSTSNLLVDQTVRLRGKPDEDTTSYLDVGTLLPTAGKGVYEITLRAKEKREPATEPEEQDTGWSARRSREETDGDYRIVATTSSRLLLTDLHVIAKVSGKGPDDPYARKALVWALDVHTNQAVSGAEVKLVRPSGHVMASCRTDSSGGCGLDVPVTGVDDTPPVAIVVTKGDDLTYVRFSDLQVDTEADTSGEPYLSEQPYTAAVYADRGVYRPGDTAHVTAILRGRDHRAPAAGAAGDGLPVVAQVYDPRNKAVKKRVITTNAAGMASLDVPFADFATTGRWRVVLEVADRTVGSTSFNVEEFVPERMRVDVKGGETAVTAEAEVPFDVEALWLFGGSATGSRVEMDCQVEPVTFTAVGLQDWHFGPSGIDDDARPLSLGKVAGRIGDDGHAAMACPPTSRSGGFRTAGQMVARVAVFEGESGRSTAGTASVPVHPEKFYVGLRAAGGEVAQEGRTKVEGMLVDWSGKAAPKAASQVDVELFRLTREYGWVWDEAQGTSVYRRMHRRSREGAQKAKVADGRFTFEFEPADRSEDYLVVATAGNARTELHLRGTWSYWWDDWGYSSSQDTTPRPERPQLLVLDAPETIGVGQTATVRTNAPWSGKMLLAVETHEIVFHQWKDVAEGPVEWSFSLEGFVPNAYVTALLIKDPHAESAEAFLPDRAFGARSVRVQPAEYTHGLKVTAPTEIRPNSKLDVELDLGGAVSEPTFATVAVVDEGILSLTKFESPNPFEDIFRKRALGVESYETVGWTMMIPPGGPSSHTGGDEDLGGGRVQMVKPVSLWSGVVPVAANGKAKVSFEVPAYRGQLRVMAVTAGTAKMGHADAKVTVRDPLTLQTTLPRFLVDDDTALIPVTLTNLSGKPRDVVVKIAATDLGKAGKGYVVDAKGREAPVSFPKGMEQRISLKPDETGTVVFEAVATRAPGAVTIQVSATAGELTSFEALDLPIEPSQPEARTVRKVTLSDTSADLRPLLADWLPGSDRTTFWLTTNPYAPQMTHLAYLVRYPYGCIEQTTSSARPLLFVGEMLDEIDPKLLEDRPVDKYLAGGIDRILSMQTPTGGFAYWPGGSQPTEWGSAYATHFLLDAQKLGHPVPKTATDDALAYLQRVVDGQADDPTTDRTDAYVHYVLALGGKPRTAQASKALAAMAKGDRVTEERYLLMAALYLGGDRRYEAELRAPDTSPLRTDRPNDWTFWSDLRSRGMMLSIYHDLFGADAKGQALADVVAQGLADRRSSWYTTQELVWGVTGLGKWTHGADTKIGKATLEIDGNEVAVAGDAKSNGAVWEVSRASLAQSVDLSLKKTGDAPIYLVATVEGTRRVNDLPEGGESLSISRELLDASGQRADASALELGEQLYVRLTIRNTAGRHLDNLALVDRLPAGLEIENARLGRDLVPDWLDASEQWGPDHMNVRDDRVEVFGALGQGQVRQVVYAVRAVTAGTFTQPEIRVEAMYDPRIWARQRGDSVRIHAPWEGS